MDDSGTMILELEIADWVVMVLAVVMARFVAGCGEGVGEGRHDEIKKGEEEYSDGDETEVWE